MKNSLSVLFLLFLLVCSAPAFAQNGTCNVNTIEISTDSYEIGDFASVKRNLELCVQNQSFGNATELNKARELLGWEPATKRGAGLGKTVEYFKTVLK